MVVGSDEFDRVGKCDHEEWSIGEVCDFHENHVIFKVVCEICGEEGYRSYDMKFHEMWWD